MINLIALILFAFNSHALPPDSNTGYIDHHVHVACYGYQTDCYFSKEIRDSFKFRVYQHMFDFSEKEAKRYGDAEIFKKLERNIIMSKYIKQAVVLAMDEVYEISGKKRKDLTVFYVPNEFVAKETSKRPNLLFGASVHPYRPDALAQLEKVKADGAYLVKLLPAIQRFKANDPGLIPYYQKLIALNLPLLIHVDDESSFGEDHPEYSNPQFLELPLSLGVKVVAAHAGARGERNGKTNFQAVLELAQKYKNLFVDISAMSVTLTRNGQLVKILKAKELQGRIVYGSDWPLSHGLTSSPYYHVPHIGFKKAYEISKINNLWDRDVRLKKAYGAPESAFTNSIY
ncbi:amidohydrolase family protein [bacterium]|nr:amidohydrolase family protein [bacterium]